jgi:cytochrome c oxidase subunit 4
MSTSTAQHEHHILPLKTYLASGAALFVLTVVTVAVSFVDLGGWNVVVALLVAATKASVVALIFMHLLYDKKLFLIIFLASIMFLAVFIIFTMFDTMRRGEIHEESAGPIQKNAAMYDSIQPDEEAVDSLPDVPEDGQ